MRHCAWFWELKGEGEGGDSLISRKSQSGWTQTQRPLYGGTGAQDGDPSLRHHRFLIITNTAHGVAPAHPVRSPISTTPHS